MMSHRMAPSSDALADPHQSAPRFRGAFLSSAIASEELSSKRPRPDDAQGSNSSLRINPVSSTICSFTRRYDRTHGGGPPATRSSTFGQHNNVPPMAVTPSPVASTPTAGASTAAALAASEEPLLGGPPHRPQEAPTNMPALGSEAAGATTPLTQEPSSGNAMPITVAPGRALLEVDAPTILASTQPTTTTVPCWFPSIALLGCDMLDGAVGDVVLDVRLFGRFLSQHPEAFDDATERLLHTYSGGPQRGSADANRIMDDGIEVFVWVIAADRGYEVLPADVPRIPFLCALLAAPRVRKCLLHVGPLLRLVGCLVGPAALCQPCACYDLALVDVLLHPWHHCDAVARTHNSHPFSGSVVGAACRSLFDRLRSLVDDAEWCRWGMVIEGHQRDATIDAPSSFGGVDSRRLGEVERQLRVLANGFASARERIELHVASYAVVATPSVTADGVGDDRSCPLMLDTFVEWQCVRMMLSGTFVDMRAADAAIEWLNREREACAGRFIDFLTAANNERDLQQQDPSAPGPTLPPIPTLDDVLGDMQPVMAIMYLTAASSVSAAPDPAATPTDPREVAAPDAVEHLERLASSSPQTACSASASDFLRLMSLKRCANELTTFVRKFSVRHRQGPPPEASDPAVTAADAATSATRRIFPTWTHKAGTTGRVFASRPNLQTLPKSTNDRWLLLSLAASAENNRDKHRDELPAAAGTSPTLRSTPPLIRHLLRGPPGTVLVVLDYAQIELRLLAHLSRDQVLLDAFSAAAAPPRVDDTTTSECDRGGDIFMRIAMMLFQSGDSCPAGGAVASCAQDVFAAQRRCAKTLVYSILYGMSAEGVQHLLMHDATLLASFSHSGLEPALGNNVVGRFFEVFRGVDLYIQHVRSTARRDGAVKGVLRTRWVAPPPPTASSALRRFDREVLSAAVQGSAADVLKLAMRNIDDMLPSLHEHHRASLVGPQVPPSAPTPAPPGPAVLLYAAHDELVYAVPTSIAPSMGAWLHDRMVSVGAQLQMRVPLRVKYTIEEHL